MPLPIVSVIIPTYKDWKRLELCLRSLQAQSYPVENIEIIVVNNAPDDPLPPGFKVPVNSVVLEESKPGSYAARNKAVKVAKGSIIGFTDSDCIADTNWVKNAVGIFQQGKVDRIAGHIELFYKESRKSAAELFESVYAFRQEKNAREGVSVTGNLWVRADLFDSVGMFDEDLYSGGDFDWNKRAGALNYNIVYRKDVIINHPARDSVAQLIKKEKRVAGWIGNRKTIALKRTAKYIVPPLNSLMHGKSLSISQRLTVFGLRYWLNILRTKEEMLIAFGKKSNRE